MRTDARGSLDAYERSLARRPEAIRRILAQRGRLYERDLVRRYLSGRPGLNRVSKQAAAGFVSHAFVRGDSIVLTFGTRRPYVRFHTDTYTPKGLPRRNPVRVLSGALWREQFEAPDLWTQIASAGFRDA